MSTWKSTYARSRPQPSQSRRWTWSVEEEQEVAVGNSRPERGVDWAWNSTNGLRRKTRPRWVIHCMWIRANSVVENHSDRVECNPNNVERNPDRVENNIRNCFLCPNTLRVFTMCLFLIPEYYFPFLYSRVLSRLSYVRSAFGRYYLPKSTPSTRRFSISSPLYSRTRRLRIFSVPTISIPCLVTQNRRLLISFSFSSTALCWIFCFITFAVNRSVVIKMVFLNVPS